MFHIFAPFARHNSGSEGMAFAGLFEAVLQGGNKPDVDLLPSRNPYQPPEAPPQSTSDSDRMSPIAVAVGVILAALQIAASLAYVPEGWEMVRSGELNVAHALLFLFSVGSLAVAGLSLLRKRPAVCYASGFSLLSVVVLLFQWPALLYVCHALVAGSIFVVTWTAFRGAPDFGLVLPPDASLLAFEGFIPQGFVDGIEILNDDQTPMELVVSVLEKQVGLDGRTALKTMLEIHTRGGVLLPFPSSEEAERVAMRAVEYAKAQKHSLRCRAVRAQQA